MHGDEIEYVFGHPLNMSLQYNARERDLSLRIMKAYSRFALTGYAIFNSIILFKLQTFNWNFQRFKLNNILLFLLKLH